MGSPAPFLALRVTTGVTPILAFYDGLGVTALGSTFGTLDAGTSTSNQPVNRAVYFTGNNIYGSTSGSAGSIYAAVGNSIHRSLDGGNSWVVATTLPSISGNTADKSGLNIVTGSNGLQYLCIMYTDTGAILRGARSADGYTWTFDGPVGVSGFGIGGGFTQDTVLGSALYCLTSDVVGGAVLSYEPGSGTLTSYLAISAAENLIRAAMCVWDNEIYIAGYNTTTGTRPLYKIAGGKLLQVANLATSGNTATTANKLGMFVDASSLYVFSLQVASSTGWACYQVDTPGTYTVTNITSTVISGNMAGAGPGTSSRVLTLVDGEYSPGSNPPKYVLYAANGTAGTAFELFRWNGANAAMTSLGTGGDVVHALTISKRIASNGTYYPNGVYAYVISSNATTSGTVGWRVNFTLWGWVGTITSIRLWYGEANQEYPDQVGTLADPSSGSLGANNTSITGLTVDDGFTTYAFTWVPPSSITSSGSRFNFSLQPF